jgi:hypothetical protein
MTIPYYSLDRSIEEIRILVLRPGPQESFPLRIDIEHVPLDKAIFSALSYVWGQQVTDRAPIDIDYSVRDDTGERIWIGSSSTTIGENLGWALFHLRQPRKELNLWVDALCINQRDDVEKTWQVQLMGRIYAKADMTYIFLGPTTDTRGEALAHSLAAVGLVAERFKLLECWHKYGSQQMSHALGEGSLWRKADNEITSDAHREILQAGKYIAKLIFEEDSCAEFFTLINNLASCPWWKRVWVIQELIFAKDATFVFADRRVERDLFILVIHFAEGMREAYTKYNDLNQEDEVIRSLQIYMRNQVPVLDPRMFFTTLLKLNSARSSLRRYVFGSYVGQAVRASPLQATDPRDLIFALLGLAESDMGIVIDYTHSVQDVFEMTTLAFLVTGDAEFLVIPRLGSSTLELASWATDWTSIPYNATTWMHFRASRNSEARISRCMFFDPTDDKGVLKLALAVSGMRVCVINEVDLTFGEHFGSIWDLEESEVFEPHALKEIQAQVIPHMNLSEEKLIEKSDHFAKFFCQLQSWLLKLLAYMEKYASVSSSTHWQTALETVLFGFNTHLNSNGSHSRLRDKIQSKEDLLNPVLWLSTTSLGYGLAHIDDTRQLAYQSRIFASLDGRVGYAPDHAEKGDMVVVFLGVPSPIVVRSLYNGAFTVVGPAYVPGIMEGELLDLEDCSTSFVLL